MSHFVYNIHKSCSCGNMISFMCFFVFLKEGKSSLGKFFKQGPWKSQSTQINLDDEEDDDEEEDIDDETLTHHIAIKSVMIGSMRTMAEGPMVIDKMGVCMRVKCKSFFFIHCCSYYSIVNIIFLVNVIIVYQKIVKISKGTLCSKL